ncbi:MAG: CidA/LrgA family protein [Lachnospiraceae bacterium]|nr:CidA/LrgA family protein [Lachnospiraceae bacterium]
MKYIRECTIIFGITLIGELLNHVLPLPIPAGVYGLFLLLVLLCSGVVKLKDVESTGDFLLEIMLPMFIPACVGLMESYTSMAGAVLPLVATCMISTMVVMAVTGKTAEWMLKAGRKKKEDEII